MVKDKIEGYIKEALKELDIETEDIFVEKTANSSNGDYASNVAMVYAKRIGKNPKELAEKIAGVISDKNYEYFEKVESAGPGFLNFYLSTKTIEESLRKIKETKNPSKSTAIKINIEFVSVNPTGRLHVGHGRGVFYGDALANILEFSGKEVTREFYINDSKESAQIKELGKTALGVGEQYKTEDISKKIENMDFVGLDEQAAGFKLAEVIQKDNQNFIQSKLGVKFDIWYSEDKKLRRSGLVEKMLEILKGKDLIYEKDGASWIKTSNSGDDEDRVVIRSGGAMTYFMSDIAYHQDKFDRGYDGVIDIWGADHHGHVKRMKAVHDMLGWIGSFDVFITQLVTLKEGGKKKKLSKRAGNVILLEDMADELGVDVLRWFFLEKSLGTHMEFDVELAREQSSKNPVYYVQYAHARIASILNKTKDLNGDESFLNKVLENSTGRDLALKLIEFEEIIEEISKNNQVHKLTTYVYELASVFSGFYRDVKVIKGNEYNSGAVEIVKLTKYTIAKSLLLLGISSPNSM